MSDIPRRALSVPVHVTGSWPRKSTQPFNGRTLRETMGKHIHQPLDDGRPDINRREERSHTLKRQLMMKEIQQKALRNATKSSFPLNLVSPLYFSISKSTRFPFANDTKSENIMEWKLRLDKGIFTLSVTTIEGKLGITYEACFEGTYQAEERIPTLSEQKYICRPTSGTAYGTVDLRLVLQPTFFEWRRKPWYPDHTILRVESLTEEQFKPDHHLEKIENKYFLLSIGPFCDPECAIVTGPYKRDPRPKPHDMDKMYVDYNPIPNDKEEIATDSFTPTFIFDKARDPETLILPTMERVRPHIISYANRPVVGQMKAAYNCSPRLSQTLYPKDHENRGPKRGDFAAPGLFHEWKKGMNAPLDDSFHQSLVA